MNNWLTRLRASAWGLMLFGLGIVEILVAAVIAIVACLSMTVVGALAIPPAIALVRGQANLSRRLAARWGAPIAVPYEPGGPGPTGPWRRIRELGSDRATWRDLLWLVTDPLVGACLAGVPGALILYGLFGVVVQPFVFQPIDRAGGSNWYTFIHVDSAASAAAAIPVGLVLIAAGLLMAPAVLRTHARWTRRLLAPSQAAQLRRRVGQLADSRAVATDSQAAELRRIERDLHDGAQARLVAMGMTLDDAEHLMGTDPQRARDLVVSAREASSTALAELRDLVRGIHPPVLADRGLTDAVRAVALDCPVAVAVTADLPGRPSPAIETAMYFAVTEAITNAVKHSRAKHIAVALSYNAGVLCASVRDDGRGGADPAAGTGLRGIQRRLSAFDGTMQVSSPAGGPTTIILEIRCALSSPRTSSSSETA
jgi:signal transduction histidine kinase